MQAFEKLKVWQVARELALLVHRTTRSFPSAERFGLTAQVRRSAGSVMANIAEASASRHPREFARILNIAEKEAAETMCHVILAGDLGYLSAGTVTDLVEKVDHVRRMLAKLQERLAAHCPGSERRT